MIHNKIKIILLVWPIVLLLGIWGNSSWHRYKIDKKLLNADGLIWIAGGDHFEVLVNEHENGELLEISVKVINPEKNIIYTKTEVIDRDMFGGGFVRAVQVDQDLENEIVVWHARAKYYLDFSEGKMRKVSFDRVPQQVKDLAKSWHKYNVMAGLEMTILLIFVLSYYLLYILVKGAIGVLMRKKSID